MIHREAFCYCSSLKRIDLPDGVEEIGLDAFYSAGLESFTAPKALRTLHQSAFNQCTRLKQVQLNEGLEVLGTDEYPDGNNWSGVFAECALEGIALPSTLKVIAYNTFLGCTNLKEVRLPKGLETIGEAAFFNTTLENINFPSSLRVVGQAAFSKCEHLKTVRFDEGLEVLGTDD